MSAETMGTDRRPLATRRWAVMGRLARALSRAGVSPNAISVASVAAAGVSGAALVMTAWSSDAWALRGLYVVAAAAIQLRLLCNMIDGMVAIEGGRRSATGELYNEAPDRLSDALTLIGAGYAAGSSPEAGYVAAIMAILTAYVRALGKGAGAGSDFGGPMAKPQRMALMTGACLALAIAPETLAEAWGVGVMSVALLVVAGGSALTCVLRLARIARRLRGSAGGAAPGGDA